MPPCRNITKVIGIPFPTAPLITPHKGIFFFGFNYLLSKHHLFNYTGVIFITVIVNANKQKISLVVFKGFYIVFLRNLSNSAFRIFILLQSDYCSGLISYSSKNFHRYIERSRFPRERGRDLPQPYRNPHPT